jgi:hypothetical protein
LLVYIDVFSSIVETITGWLSHWLGSLKDEGALLLANARDQLSICLPWSLWMVDSIPNPWTYCEKSSSLMVVENANCCHNWLLLVCSSFPLVETMQAIPWVSGSTIPTWFIYQKIT